MSMNPRETTEKIRTDYSEYLASIISVKDDEIRNLAYDKIRKTDFVKGPYLETTLPFEEGKSLKKLVEDGLISKEFAKMGQSVHFDDWKLRIHQETALRHIIEKKRNMIVSTGTGSGKTECYLYPIFNELMREKENHTLDPGVRALLIFPMNALANDQQKKLRKLLRSYPDITFGRYTGETKSKTMIKGKPVTEEEAEIRFHKEYDDEHQDDKDPDLRTSIPNELMCREMMAKTPPHILLTNYAMLEYMLLRPDTAPFFDNNSAQHWRFIVIDEAHTYKGATGTEIAFLLRRLKERIRHNMHDEFRCIATSATLGSEDGKDALAHFAQDLFGEDFSAEDVITTKRSMREKPADGRYFTPEDYKNLKVSTASLSEEEKGKVLYDSLKDDLRLFHLYELLKNNPEKIESLSNGVFSDINDERLREDALVDLIELAAAARKSMNDPALLPARYHLFVKSLEGMFAQFYPQKSVFLERREKESGHRVFELANCQHCGQEYLVGKTIDIDGKNYFVQTSNEEKPEFYFISQSDNTTDFDEFDEDDTVENHVNFQKLKKFNLCLNCGRISEYAERIPYDCCEESNHKKIVTVYQLSYAGKTNESNSCPCCGTTKKGLIKRFLTANQPATFAVGKSLYDALPPHPYQLEEKDSPNYDDLFTSDDESISEESQILDESGRKLLVFSDNRQEAAFFAGNFEKKYRLIMWRKAILHVLQKADGNELYISDLIGRVRDEADNTGLFSLDIDKNGTMTPDEKEKMAAHYVMNEFMASEPKTGLEGMGYVRITPDALNIPASKVIAGLHGNEIWNAICYMMDTMRKRGVVTYPEKIHASDDFFAPRNRNGFFKREEFDNKVSNGFVFGFVPQDGSINKRLAFMMKLENDTEIDGKAKQEDARKHLKELYDVITSPKSPYVEKILIQNKGIVYCLNYKKWKMKLLHNEDVIYRCKKCGMVTPYSIRGVCPEMKCNGELETVLVQDLRKNNYYDRIYKDSKLIPMIAREHTAQLTSETAGYYQKYFEEGKINVLSCSTTFEMGVDVGELEAIFQRNVPPETSNYIQRAGRAGRRTSSAAFSVTFARRSSHDMTFFQDPPRIINGKITAPILKIQNEKIAKRHLNSVVVSWFFKKNPDYFHLNTSRIVGCDAKNMSEALRESLSEKPSDLLQSIHNVFNDNICNKLGVDDWKFVDDLIEPEGSLIKAIQERKTDIQSLSDSSEVSANSSPEERNIADKASKLVNLLKEEPSINFLSSHGVLPKYGFPVDTVSLDTIGGSIDDNKKIDLSRDLKMAISEFAPSAEIVANGKVWKSYALKTIPDKTWPAHYYYECPICKHIYPSDYGMITIIDDPDQVEKKICPKCKRKMKTKKFIIPKFGFTTSIKEAPKTVGETRPSTYYATQTQFWGIGDITEKEKSEALERNISIGNKNVEISYSPGGKLFVLNQGINGGGFFVCPTCGFACDATKIKTVKTHKTALGRNCSNKQLYPASLGHEFYTDFIRIKLPFHVVNLKSTSNIDKKDQYLSTLFAILEGACSALEISRNDINGCLGENGEIILYDDTPGGSGFVKRIYEKFEDILPVALEKVSGNQCGCAEETSCYGCLRNYSNQYYHDMLSRGLAYNYLDWLMNQHESEISDVPIQFTNNHIDPALPVGNKILIPSGTYQKPTKDTKSAIEYKIADCDDQDRRIMELLLSKAPGSEYEWPYIDTQIEDIWPTLFWFDSKTAVFLPSVRVQYQKMKKYDWFCYLLDEDTDMDIIFSHIRKGI